MHSCRPSFICPSHGVNALRCSPLCCACLQNAHHRTSVSLELTLSVLPFSRSSTTIVAFRVQFSSSQTVELQSSGVQHVPLSCGPCPVSMSASSSFHDARPLFCAGVHGFRHQVSLNQFAPWPCLNSIVAQSAL